GGRRSRRQQYGDVHAGQREDGDDGERGAAHYGGGRGPGNDRGAQQRHGQHHHRGLGLPDGRAGADRPGADAGQHGTVAHHIGEPDDRWSEDGHDHGGRG